MEIQEIARQLTEKVSQGDVNIENTCPNSFIFHLVNTNFLSAIVRCTISVHYAESQAGKREKGQEKK